VFGSTKCGVNFSPSADDDLHRPNRLNFFRPHVAILACQPNSVDDLSIPGSPCVAHNMFPILFQGGIMVNEIMRGDGIWHIDQCPLSLVVQCSTLQNNINVKCTCKINTHKMTSGTPTPC
jgi:hypothetical protein